MTDDTYYDLPLLKPPVWTWEVPLYFFVGGAAGASAVFAAAAQLTGADRKLVRDARRIAAAGAVLSGPLLIADLGRPERFLNMLRVFKPQSPMSVGAWTLAAFGASSTGAALFKGRLGDVAAVVAAATGLVMSTYTGVLLGATAIPVWAKHKRVLPILFGASAVASAAALLELRGHQEPALNALGFAAAAAETALTPRRARVAGEITALAAQLFSGPLPALLRLASIKSKRLRRVAAGSALLGSLLTRLAWVEAGKASARDPRPALQ
ncbi:MAG: NrfD/PsrC family molybdoenzyme membrane anchor subunit [Acidobacteriota bacterium]